jgi:ubiquitin carboxyl-terminal hydrolase 9/13
MPSPATPITTPQAVPENTTGKIPLPSRANGSHHDDPPPSNSPIVTAHVPPVGASTIGGLFNSLRRGPSARVRTTPSVLDSRKSYMEPSPRLTPTDGGQAGLTLSPPPPSLPLNGEGKAPERKASTWFKRKGTKMRPDSGSEHTPSLVQSPADGNGGKNSPSQVWRRYSGQASREEGSQQPSEPSVSNDDGPPVVSSQPQSGMVVTAGGSRDRRNGYDSPSAGSVSSSFASTSAIHTSHGYGEMSGHSGSLPTVPPMSRNTQTPSPTMRMSRQPHRSLTHLNQKGKSPDTRENEGIPASPKPDKSRSNTSIPPVPRLPQLPPVPGQIDPRVVDRRSPQRYDREDRVANAPRTREGANETPNVRPNSHYPNTSLGSGLVARAHTTTAALITRPDSHRTNAELGLGSFGSANTSSSTTSSAGQDTKRTTRKLSLTAPMLGFGRKDREKQKEKEKDRDKGTSSTPTIYTPFSMMTPRI